MCRQEVKQQPCGLCQPATSGGAVVLGPRLVLGALSAPLPVVLPPVSPLLLVSLMVSFY